MELWTVSESQRPWAMLHDTFSAWYVRAPRGANCGRWWSRGEERPLSGGSVLLFEPGEAHRVALSKPISLAITWWEPSFIARTANELGVSGKLHFRAPELKLDTVSDSLDELCALLDEGEDAAAVQALHAEFLSGVIETVGEGAPARRPRGRYHPGVRRAVKYLATHLRDAVSLNDLAAAARMSKYHLVRVFREAEGFAPHQYLTLLRVREARRLVESGLSVVEAAGQAGFVDASHLSRTFRSWLGIAPGAWGRAFRASEPAYRRAPLTIPPPAELDSLAMEVG